MSRQQPPRDRPRQSEPMLPPGNAEAELAAVTVLIIHGDGAPPEFRAELKGEHFFDPILGRLWDRLGEFAEAGLHCGDPAMREDVFRFLKSDPDWDAFWRVIQEIVTRPDERLGHPSNCVYYAKRIIEDANTRLAMRGAERLVRAAYGGSTREHLMDIAETITAPLAEPVSKDVMTLAEAMVREAADVAEGPRPLLASGLCGLDRELGGGYWMGEFISIGGIESHGKTALAMHHVNKWTAAGHKGVFISVDMQAAILGRRSLQANTDVMSPDWEHTPQIIFDDAVRYAETHAKCFIYDTLTHVREICAAITKHVKQDKARFFVLDFIQAVQASGKSRNEQVYEATRRLSDLHKELGVTAVILCQVNKEMRNRKNFWPRNEDLADSAAMRQFSDVIMFPVYPYKLDKTRRPDEFEIYVTKNRNRGTKGELVECRFDGARQAIYPSLTDEAKEMYESPDRKNF